VKKALLLLSRHLESALERLDPSIRVPRLLDAPDPESLRHFSDLPGLARNVDALVVLATETEHTRGMVNR
jgi:phosphoglycerate dehydrogenase-like enzyme